MARRKRLEWRPLRFWGVGVRSRLLYSWDDYYLGREIWIELGVCALKVWVPSK